MTNSTTRTIIAFHISSGDLNAMYTLRRSRLTTCGSETHYHENYVCNLSMDRAKAVAKAEDLVERFRANIEESENFKIVFEGEPDFDLCWDGGTPRTKTSARDLQYIAQIESGYFPFGKFRDTQICLAPDTYILYFAKNQADSNPSAVSQALISACTAEAFARDLFRKRDEETAAKAALDAKSKHIGTIGERIQFDAILEGSFLQDDGYNAFYINRLRQGEDIITYIGGRSLGVKGDRIKFKAAIHEHTEYKGALSTRVKRPSKVEVIREQTI